MMAVQDTATNNDREEECEDCGRETPHGVDIRIVDESNSGSTKYAREPYRIATCQVCGAERAQRMNDA